MTRQNLGRLAVNLDLDTTDAKARLEELEEIINRMTVKFQSLRAEMERLAQVARTTG